jgi:hypothetical protein
MPVSMRAGRVHPLFKRLSSLAETLGRTRRTLNHYRIGSRPIPKVNGPAKVGKPSGRGTAAEMPVTRHPRVVGGSHPPPTPAESMEARLRPIGDLRHPAMLDRIEVNVVQVRVIIPLILDRRSSGRAKATLGINVKYQPPVRGSSP